MKLTIKKLTIKFSYSFLAIFLGVFLSIIGLNSVNAQIGNQSDITNPDAQELVVPINSSNVNTNTENSTEYQIDRDSFDNNISTEEPETVVAQTEELQALEFSSQLNAEFFGEISSPQEIADSLSKLASKTQRNAALIYVISTKNNLQLIMIPPSGVQKNLNKNLNKNEKNAENPVQVIRKIIPEAKKEQLEKVVQQFRSQVGIPIGKRYLANSKQLYQWMIAPLEADLEKYKIQTLIFSLDNGLRIVPIAALHDGKKFLIEKYSLGIIPSFNLTDTSYYPIGNADILVMGISQSTEDQISLPSVNAEIDILSNKLWPISNPSQRLLNQETTIENLASISSQKKFRIIHLATHGDFQAGKIDNSYIQFWNEKMRLNDLRTLSQQLKWNQEPKVEMLVLSACRTALGSKEAELGFAGLAVQAGVKTVLGSLWYVSDEATMALMSKFYEQLKITSLRSESLRLAQVAMLKGELRIEGNKLYLSPNKFISLPTDFANIGKINLSHPFYWSAFTIIGNWN